MTWFCGKLADTCWVGRALPVCCIGWKVFIICRFYVFLDLGSQLLFTLSCHECLTLKWEIAVLFVHLVWPPQRLALYFLTFMWKIGGVSVWVSQLRLHVFSLLWEHGLWFTFRWLLLLLSVTSVVMENLLSCCSTSRSQFLWFLPSFFPLHDIKLIFWMRYILNFGRTGHDFTNI